MNPHGTAHYGVGFGIVFQFHVGNSISNLDSQCVEVCLRPDCRRRGGLEETSSSSRTERIVQRDANGWREANVILRSGNAPVAERSGCPTSKARSLAKQGRKRSRENPNHRSFYSCSSTKNSEEPTSNIKLQTLTLYTAKIFLAFCALALSGCVSLDLASAAKLASALKMDFFPDLRPQESHELIKKLPNMV